MLPEWLQQTTAAWRTHVIQAAFLLMTYLRSFQWLTLAGLVAAGAWGVSREGRGTAQRTAVQPTKSTVLLQSPLIQSGDSDASKVRRVDSTTQEFLAAVASIQAEPDPIARERRIQSVLAKISPTEIEAWVKNAPGQNPTDLSRELLSRLIRRWAEIDPRSAADWVTRMPPGEARQQAIASVAIAWANSSLPEAIDWALKLQDENERQSGALSIAREALRTEPITALELAGQLPDSPERNEVVSQAASQWAATEPENAVEWATQINDESLRNIALSNIATVWAAADPIAAAALAVDSISPGRAQNDAVVSIVQRWVQKDAQATAAWVEQFPEGTLRDHAIEGLAQLWTNRDPEHAGQWVNALPSSAGRDSALVVYVTQIAVKNPDLAAQWAAKIGDVKQRNQALETVAADRIALTAH